MAKTIRDIFYLSILYIVSMPEYLNMHRFVKTSNTMDGICLVVIFDKTDGLSENLKALKFPAL